MDPLKQQEPIEAVSAVAANPSPGSLTTSVTTTTIDVTAPMDLQEGYQLQVDVNGQPRTVTVPPGGVRKGDVFTVTETVEDVLASPGGVGGISGLGSVPHNAWRDGLCDCCSLGCCHSVCCLGFWFGPILLGQIMQRMSRNFVGCEGERPSASKTCMVVTIIYVIFMAIEIGISASVEAQAGCAGANYQYDVDSNNYVLTCPDGSTANESSVSRTLSSVLSILSTIFFVYLLVSTCLTRSAIRKKYNIPSSCCGECEDCCCAYWCFCCSVQQMARHTHDYRAQPVGCCSGECFSKTGQPAGTPEIV